MWFTKLMIQFFFWIDKIVYNFIPLIYDLLLDIARTSILTQADIANMAERIYKLLAIFMIFKVTLSLIMYVVNPDDFSDKSKGVAKLGTNIVISLALLILTPYIFNYAYQVQTIILEDNSLATLIFGEDTGEESFLNSAGDKMSYMTMSAFFSPNLSLGNLYECSNLYEIVEGEDGEKVKKFNQKCLGTEDTDGTLMAYTKENPNFSKTTLDNYVAGVEHSNLGLMFRQDMALATTSDGSELIMDYKFVFSTAVGVIIILLLITFCMDVAVRSLKLAFFQLIAPIPILSYIDPKSGKDGLFKKWYEMCFKTFLSLFIRLLALYFAVYVISKVADMQLVDVIDGSYVGGWNLLTVFIIIGALMFAKQLPEILKGLGIKLDGDGKFTLNPLKKFEEGTVGGKRLTGAVGGMVAGAIGGKGIGAISGAARGFMANKGYKGGLDRQADVNRKLREARINGAGFWGSRLAVASSRYGLDDADLERDASRLRKDKRSIELKRRQVDQETKGLEVKKKAVENSISPKNTVISKQRDIAKNIGDVESFSTTLIESGKAGKYSAKYKDLKSSLEYLNSAVPGQKADRDIFDADGLEPVVRKGETITSEHALKLQGEAERYSKKVGRKAVVNEMLSGSTTEVGGADVAEFNSKWAVYNRSVESLNEYLDTTDFTEYNQSVENDGTLTDEQKEMYKVKKVNVVRDFGETHEQAGTIARAADRVDVSISKQKDEIAEYDRQIKDIQATTTVDEITIVDENGQSRAATIEEAERLIKEREQVLKDKQDQRKLQRGYAKDSRIGGGS